MGVAEHGPVTTRFPLSPLRRGLFIPGYLIPAYWIGLFDVIPTPNIVRAILLSQARSGGGGELAPPLSHAHLPAADVLR